MASFDFLVSLILLFVAEFTSLSVLVVGERACQSPVFCYGPVLQTIQAADLYSDSKVFVDRPLKFDPSVVESAFNPSLPREQLRMFVDQYFLESGIGLDKWVPPDWTESPKFVSEIRDSTLRDWALELNKFWKELGRITQKEVMQNPNRYTLIDVPHPFMIAGGRFSEFYYWDSFWIVKGLLLCEMYDTARGMILNLASLVDRYGLVPNGGRTYYSRRSQPPLLTQMASLYYETTGNDTFLREILPSLDREYEFWSQNRTLTEGNYTGFNVYFSQLTDPRPEAYREDIATSLSVDDPEQLYTNLASAAESGWDFSSRWLAHSRNLSTIRTTDVLPVDLNAILCGNEAILAKLHRTAGDDQKARSYENAFQSRQAMFDSIFWSDTLGFWSDVLMTDGQHQKNFYLAFLAPLAWKCVKENITQQLLLHSTLKKLKFFDYVGGVPTSLVSSGQQWDFPNSWAPLQWYLIHSWYNSSSPVLRDQALSVATKWINTTYAVWRQKGVMYEKYDVINGDPGSGGEYVVQTGFGWTNAVVLYILQLYGDRLHAVTATPQPLPQLWIVGVVLGITTILFLITSVLCGVWCRYVYIKGKTRYWRRVHNEHLLAASGGGRDRDDSQGSDVLLVSNSMLSGSTEGILKSSDDYRTYQSNNHD